MKYKISILFCLFQMIFMPLLAQNQLKINDAFDKYGKQKGSILLQLSSDILSQGSNIKFYKSLILEENTQNRQDILNALKSDTEGQIIIAEVKKNGKIESGTYYLGKDKSSMNQFILYKSKGGKITLVYINGNFRVERLDGELKKLKDLFIYANNKRIKLQ